MTFAHRGSWRHLRRIEWSHWRRHSWPGRRDFGSNLIFRDHDTVTEWADIYENEADEQSLHYMLDQGYDVREAPRLYARLQAGGGARSAHRPRVHRERHRMKARTAHIQTVLSGDFKTAWEAKLKGRRPDRVERRVLG